MREWALTWLA